MAGRPDRLERPGEDERQAFDWVGHPPLAAIIAALEAAGGAPMFVGGCVRDSLIGRPPELASNGSGASGTDIDIATVLTPEATVAALKAAGLKAVPTGFDHGTVTALADGFVAEVTSLRADIDTDGRHAQVAFTTDWDEDWRRRDFTINAIYLAPDLSLYDPAGGRAALARQEVAFIGEAARRIEEDYLRILRFYRFSARYAAALDAAGAAACRELKDGLAGISRERIGQEMMKILAGPRRAFVLEAMEADGILGAICSAPADLSIIRELTELPDVAAEVVLAALWPRSGTGAKGSIAAAFRLSNAAAARRRAALSAAALMPAAPQAHQARAIIYEKGAQAFLDGLALARAREETDAGEGGGVDPAPWEAARALAGTWPVPVCPVTSAMMIEAGVVKGPALGAALKRAEALWIARDFPGDDVSLAEIVVQCAEVAAREETDQSPGGSSAD